MRSEQAKAVIPHQLLIFNLLVFNIMLPIAALLNSMERVLLPIAITCSLSIIFFIWYRAKFTHQTLLINAHWNIVWKRCRIVLIAYSISLSIELLSTLMTSFQTDPQLRSIMMIAFTRIAIVPTLLIVTPLLISSTIAMTKIRKGKLKTGL
ncbi:MAG TPA: hypothetical protein ENI26_14205 [Methylophaga aminisulfidivorans]|uniref:Uncharacterized protein n=2 Tax=root TaxID=1 RepID=A0A7C1VYS0_9GAMM|nr:hypothetical protein [Methylophaga sp.]HEC75499.1 hypothetical protein [Methylophaga aminisulfidivorans]